MTSRSSSGVHLQLSPVLYHRDDNVVNMDMLSGDTHGCWFETDLNLTDYSSYLDTVTLSVVVIIRKRTDKFISNYRNSGNSTFWWIKLIKLCPKNFQFSPWGTPAPTAPPSVATPIRTPYVRHRSGGSPNLLHKI